MTFESSLSVTNRRPRRSARATFVKVAAGAGLTAVLAATFSIGSPASAQPVGGRPVLEAGVSAERGGAVVKALIAEGVIASPAEVISISTDGVALRGNAFEPWIRNAGKTDQVSVTSAAARTSTAKGGGRKTTSGGTTILIGGGGTLAPGTYALIAGPGLLTSYLMTATPGTPTYMRDGMTASASDAVRFTGSAMSWGPASAGGEPLNGEVRLSAWSTQVCGSDQAAGCTTTWYDGSKVLKAEVRVRTSVPSSIARCVIGHELGHGLGLGHVNDPSQLMNPLWSQGSSPCSFQGGDGAGLTMMGATKSTL